VGMSNHPHRRGPRGRRLVSLPHAASEAACGCSHLAVIDFDAVCGDCGGQVRDQVVVPTSGEAGDTRVIGASCACGGHAVGTGVVVELLPT
jgi:hypothetical protein